MINAVQPPSVAGNGLRDRVLLALSSANYSRLRYIEVEMQGDAVLVRGELDSYYERQIAINTVKQVSGVTRLIDHLHVR